MKTKKVVLSIVVGFLALVAAAAGYYALSQPGSRVVELGTGTSQPATGPYSSDHYAAVLTAHVDDNGMVNYKGLKAHSERLAVFAAALKRLSRSEYDAWSDQEKIAFWINAYNALTLVAIIEHYPIKADLVRGAIFPRNSIRQIPGVWNKLQFVVMGEKMTLNDIEHKMLRAKFNEPRIHMALVCAAMGCPVLRNEPYEGKRLNEQLNQQTMRFLSIPSKFGIDREKKRVYLSSIFKWFGGDFVKTYGTDEKYTGHSDAERAVLNFASNYPKEVDTGYLTSNTYSIEYLKYDWSLNEQKAD